MVIDYIEYGLLNGGIAMTDALVWLGVMVVCLLIEAATPLLYSIWFAIGALFTALFSFADVGAQQQVVFFLVVSLLLLAFTRKFALKFFKVSKTSTNTDGIIGKVGKVSEKLISITGEGRVLIDGLTWKAKSVSGCDIEKDTYVKILEIQGVTVIVEVAEESTNNNGSDVAVDNDTLINQLDSGDKDVTETK